MLINISPLCSIEFSSKSEWSSNNDADYLLRKVPKYGRYSGFSFHTSKEKGPWIKINIPVLIEINRIKIINRIDCCRYKANSLIIEAFDNECSPIVVFQNNEKDFKVNDIVFSNPIKTKCLRFSLSEDTYFHLKDISIYTDVKNCEDLFFFGNSSNILKLFSNSMGKMYDICMFSNKEFIFYRNDNLVERAIYRLIFETDEVCSFCIFFHRNLLDRFPFFFSSFIDYINKFNYSIEFTRSTIYIWMFRSVTHDFIRNFKFANNEFFLQIQLLLNTLVDMSLVSKSKESSDKDGMVVIDTDLLNMYGFADRIRGALGIIQICQSLDLKYYIKFSQPFNLLKYYTYNDFSLIDLTTKKQLIINGLNTDNQLLRHLNHPSKISFFKFIINEFSKEYEVVTIGTNNIFFNLSEIFSNNFKRTDYFDSCLEKYFKILSRDYISISFRFLGILGDFNEPNAKVLSTDDQNMVITKTRDALLTFLSAIAKDKNVLVLSDSCKFLNSLSGIKKVFYFADNIQHLSSIKNTSKDAESAFLKILIDFNLIMEARDSYIAKSDYLYFSGFPRIACSCAGRDIKIFNF